VPGSRSTNHPPAREDDVHVDGARLFTRDLGAGRPIVVLHGGPDFDHTYFLPELDLLADSFRLVYYDQRGRGRSAEGVRPEHVTLESELEDLDAVRRHLGSETIALLGHSWGGVPEMAYAGRHPDRCSQVILMNTAPGSYEDRLLLRRFWTSRRSPADMEAMAALAATDAFRQGDIATEAAYYRLHYKPALYRAEHVDEVVGRLRVHFTPETILLARAIEDRLYEETWRREDFDLLAGLLELDVPTLVLHGEHDFVPLAVAEHVVAAIPGARLRVLPRCGHFSYLEAPDEVRRELAALFL
jgi:proline iminopeptidase